MNTKRVEPGHGGCWFCYQQDGELIFETEFDTYVHLKCVREALAQDPQHPEAKFMRYLLEE